MILIKQGQTTVSEYIRDDLSAISSSHKSAMIYGLNSGKRIRSLIVTGSSAAVLAVEYIHSGLTIMYDMINQIKNRRGVPALHVKYGPIVAGTIANLLILRGLKHADSAEVTRLTEEALLLLEDATQASCTNVPPRALLEKIRTRVTRPFVIAFLLSGQTPENATKIGEAFGFCYYLAHHGIEDIKDERLVLDAFTENMKEAVTGFTKYHLWNDRIREITSYVIKRFERKIIV